MKQNRQDNNSEIHLLIIWNYGLNKIDAIKEDIEQNFVIKAEYNINWSDHYFSQNLTRFYGQNLPAGSGKETHCGRGPFRAFILEDSSPCYEARNTSRGSEIVNINLFDAKAKYRQWTGGGHRIHATNSTEESQKDIWLLLHREANSFRDEINDQVVDINIDLIGAEGWQSLSQFFETVNRLSNYVVLRNFECLPDNYFLGAHGDIDLLTDDLNNMVYITNAQKIFPQPHRVHFKIDIAGEAIPFDFRYVGDSYYDLVWQENILQTREFTEGGFYRPDAQNYFYSVLYHALIHKPLVAEDYTTRIISLGASHGLDEASLADPDYQKSILASFLFQQNYQVVVPVDSSVFFNRQIVDVGPLSHLVNYNQSLNRIFNLIRKTQDLSTFSHELLMQITGAEMDYHLGRQRHCLIRPLGIRPQQRVLEVGCECGAITRYLGEIGADVTALEPNQTMARIAALRCQDLSNVQVIQTAIEKVQHDQQYDWIVVVGKLPADIEHYKNYLTPNGKLVVAVHNSLGIHKFNADGDVFKNIGMNTPDSELTEQPGDREVSHRVLTKKLKKAGFSSIDFWYPFPDHITPQVILSSAAFSDADFAAEELLAKSYFRKTSGGNSRNFLDPLMARELVNNEMMTDLANAFLVIASPPVVESSDTTLAVSYAVGRLPKFTTETRISRKDKAIIVEKSPLFPLLDHQYKTEHFQLEQNLEPSNYVRGPLLQWQLTEARARGNGLADIIDALKPWFEFLLSHAEHRPVSEQYRLADYWIDGEYQDCTPFNLIRSDNEIVYIDKEWNFDHELPLGWVVSRSIVHSLLAFPGFEVTPLKLGEVITELCQEYQLVTDDNEIDKWLSLEKQHLSQVTGFNLFSATSKSLTKCIQRGADSASAAASQLATDNSHLLEKALLIQESTGISILTIVKSMLENRPELFNSEAEREWLKFQACKNIFDGLLEKDHQKPLPDSDKKQFYQLLETLREGQFYFLLQNATELKSQVNDWRLNRDYQRWIMNHALQEIDAQIHAERMMKWPQSPKFHFVMFMFAGEQALLADTIDSLGQQFYQQWQLTVIADSPSPDEMFDSLPMLNWVQLDAEIDPYEMLYKVMLDPAHDWVSFVPAGTRFEPQFGLQFGDYVNLQTEKLAFYCDDDFIDANGERFQPRFKPDFNLDLLRSTDYIGCLIIRRTALAQIQQIDTAPGHENLALAFRLFEQTGPSAIGHISDVLMHLPQSVLAHQSRLISQQIVQQHLDRLQINAIAEAGLSENSIRVNYQWPLSTQPLVSVIIPTKDKLEFLRPCIEAVLYKNNYLNIELIIIDNQSEDPDVLAYLSELQSQKHCPVKVLSYDYPFNYAAVINLGAKAASGDYLLFLNNDTEALHPEWLERLMQHAQRPEVGIVGARLVYPETGFIQHAGIVLGMDTIADHQYLGCIDIKEPGYMGRAQVDQDFSAVTAACMVIKKSIYEQVGGMDEVNLELHYNDIDLCLKVGQAGHLVVWTPYSVLVHHGSVTQQSEYKYRTAETLERRKAERRYMLKTWLPLIANDPSYNRNLSLASREILVESGMPVNWDTHFHDRMRIVGLPLSCGSGEYRVIQPFTALSQAGLAQCESYRFPRNRSRAVMVSEYARLKPDAVMFQASIGDILLEQIEQLAEFLPNTKRIYTIDDLLTDVPEQSPVNREIKRHFSDIKSRLRRALKASDRLVVSTQPLADLCKDMIDQIYVVPNRLPRVPWASLTSYRDQSDKPRVGWAGAQQHQGDLAIISEVVKATSEEIDWIFMGMCPEDIKPYIKEFHSFVSIEDYPAKLASLNLDLAVAPLEMHPFNEAKSNLRLLEYGILGWPVICTDIYPYQTLNPPVTRIDNNVNKWLSVIRQKLADKPALAAEGRQLKEWVMTHYILEDHLDEWLEALT